MTNTNLFAVLSVAFAVLTNACAFSTVSDETGGQDKEESAAESAAGSSSVGGSTSTGTTETGGSDSDATTVPSTGGASIETSTGGSTGSPATTTPEVGGTAATGGSSAVGTTSVGGSSATTETSVSTGGTTATTTSTATSVGGSDAGVGGTTATGGTTAVGGSSAGVGGTNGVTTTTATGGTTSTTTTSTVDRCAGFTPEIPVMVWKSATSYVISLAASYLGSFEKAYVVGQFPGMINNWTNGLPVTLANGRYEFSVTFSALRGYAGFGGQEFQYVNANPVTSTTAWSMFGYDPRNVGCLAPENQAWLRCNVTKDNLLNGCNLRVQVAIDEQDQVLLVPDGNMRGWRQ